MIRIKTKIKIKRILNIKKKKDLSLFNKEEALKAVEITQKLSKRMTVFQIWHRNQIIYRRIKVARRSLSSPRRG